MFADILIVFECILVGQIAISTSALLEFFPMLILFLFK